MDEIEFEEVYGQAAEAASKIAAPETKLAVSLTLQLVRGLREQLTEMQNYEEGEE